MVALNPPSLSQARLLADRGQYRPAKVAYKKALSERPNDVDTLIEFAVLEAQSGQFKSARRLFDRALKLRPSDPIIHLNLGEVARESGAMGVALKHYEKAHSLAPDSLDVLYALGDALREVGRSDEAIPHLEAALRQAPGDSEIHNALGIALESQGELTRAINAYRQAAAYAPGSMESWSNLGQALYHSEYFDDAITAFEKAQALSDTPVGTILISWTRSLMQLWRYDEALAIADKAISAGIDLTSAHFTKGVIREQSGDFDAAENEFRKAISLDENSGESYEKLAHMRRLEADSAPALTGILADVTLDSSARASAGFALYKLLDRDKFYDEAFVALRQANALKAESLVFDADHHRNLFQRIAQVFDASFFSSRHGQGNSSQAPIFVLGMPRSGTTLTEQILAAYDEVNPCGERQDFQNLSRTIDDYPDSAAGLSAEWAQVNGDRILSLMMGNGPATRFATNKSPGNYAFIGLIAWLFPNAKIVYCDRDPREIGLSSFEQHFRAGLSFTYDLQAFAHAYNAHVKLMRHWIEACPIPIHTIRYEELVSNPELTARALVDHCGLKWRPECLDTHKVNRPIETASVWQVRQPINTGSIGKWRRYEKQLGPMIELLDL